MTKSQSPLELFNEVAEQFNITKEKQVHPRQKKAFAESQVEEQKLIINRLLVDTAQARKNRDAATDETMKAAHQNKVTQFEGDLRQLTKTLDFFIELRDNLYKVYPEAKVESTTRPDGY